MTSVPEAPLASRLATLYVCITLITDYDCRKEGVEGVNAELAVQKMKDLEGSMCDPCR